MESAPVKEQEHHEDLLQLSQALERMLKKQTTVREIREMPSGKRFLRQLSMFQNAIMRQMIDHHIDRARQAKDEKIPTRQIRPGTSRHWKKRKRLDEYMMKQLNTIHQLSDVAPGPTVPEGTQGVHSHESPEGLPNPTSMRGQEKKTFRNAKNNYVRHNNTGQGRKLLLQQQEEDEKQQQQQQQKKNAEPEMLKCYICKHPAKLRHASNERMCVPCGTFNHAKRHQTCDGAGKVAMVTGGRIKIGYETVLSLLRNGFTVITSTRFVADAERRYREEKDFNIWKERLTILAADLRHPDFVLQLCRQVQKLTKKLDVLILNAAQTDRKPTDFYAPLLLPQLLGPEAGHSAEAGAAPSAATATTATALVTASFDHYGSAGTLATCSGSTATDIKSIAQFATRPVIPSDTLTREQIMKWFPPGKKDPNGEQLDLRPETSWNMKFEKLHPIELLETMMVNLFAPMLMTQQLLPLMSTNTSMAHSCVIMVSAVEGQFYTRAKNGAGEHAHTNASKAALHMIVRTLGLSFWKDHKIVLNAVDTGWVSAMHPTKRADETFRPPLDSIDGAARILDPVYQSFSRSTRQPVCGVLWKDYKVATW